MRVTQKVTFGEQKNLDFELCRRGEKRRKKFETATTKREGRKEKTRIENKTELIAEQEREREREHTSHFKINFSQL
jgi:5-hydroxyisourate hydrolase-like protein (transthyretin family)